MTPHNHAEYALVTGAGSGLGRAIAHELARRGYPLILVSLPGTLDDVAIDFAGYGNDMVCFPFDLSIESQVRRLIDTINSNYRISVLVNNAGIGGTRRFGEASLDEISRIIQVNIMATAMLTRGLLPNLLAQSKAWVLNVSSLAAFSPTGYKTVYPASKAFVHHFTRGLYQELRSTSVFVSVVNPGPIATNKEICARINRQGPLGRLGLLTPEVAARRAIQKLFSRDTVIILNFGNGLAWLMTRVLPIWIRLPLLTRIVERELQPR